MTRMTSEWVEVVPSGSLPSTRGERSWAWATVWIVLLLIVGIPLAYVFILWNRAAVNGPARIGSAIAQFAADAMRPQVTINDVVFTSVQELRKSSKLVVLQTTVDADVTREEAEEIWGIPRGTNTARVAVRGAKVQYVIDLLSINTGNFVTIDNPDGTKQLTLTVPHPRPDADMVAIDPAKIETLDLRGGWSRFDKQETRDNAIAELRPRVIIQANAPFLRKQADEAGIEALTHLLSPALQTASKSGLTFNIKYRD